MKTTAQAIGEMVLKRAFCGYRTGDATRLFRWNAVRGEFQVLEPSAAAWQRCDPPWDVLWRILGYTQGDDGDVPAFADPSGSIPGYVVAGRFGRYIVIEPE